MIRLTVSGPWLVVGLYTLVALELVTTILDLRIRHYQKVLERLHNEGKGS